MVTHSKKFAWETGGYVKKKLEVRVDVTFAAQYSRNDLEIQYGPLQVFSPNTTIQTLRIPPSSFGQVGFYIKVELRESGFALSPTGVETKIAVCWAVFKYGCDSTGKFEISEVGLLPEFKIGSDFGGTSGKDSGKTLPSALSNVTVKLNLSYRGGETVDEPFVKIAGWLTRSNTPDGDVKVPLLAKAVLRGKLKEVKATVPTDLLERKIYFLRHEGQTELDRGKREDELQFNRLANWKSDLERREDAKDLWEVVSKGLVVIQVEGWCSNTEGGITNKDIGFLRAKAISEDIKKLIGYGEKGSKTNPRSRGIDPDSRNKGANADFRYVHIRILEKDALEKIQELRQQRMKAAR